MNSQEFIIWLRGFTEGVHDFNITPKQWDLMKDKLAEVDDNTIPMGGILSDHNTFRVPNSQLFYPNRYGTTAGPDMGIRTTTSGYIAPVGQEIPSSIFTSSSTSVGTVTYNPAFPGTTVTYTVTSGSDWSGGTTYTYPNGTTVSYTAGGANEFNDPKDKTLLHD